MEFYVLVYMKEEPLSLETRIQGRKRRGCNKLFLSLLQLLSNCHGLKELETIRY